MIFLLLGYAFVHLVNLFGALEHGDFSLVEVLIVSIISIVIDFIPVLGYLAGKLMGGKGVTNKLILVGFGVTVGIIEYALLELGVLTVEQSKLSTSLSAFLFFVIAFSPFTDNKLTTKA